MLTQITSMLGLTTPAQSQTPKGDSAEDLDFADVFAAVGENGKKDGNADGAGQRLTEGPPAKDVPVAADDPATPEETSEAELPDGAADLDAEFMFGSRDGKDLGPKHMGEEPGHKLKLEGLTADPKQKPSEAGVVLPIAARLAGLATAIPSEGDGSAAPPKGTQNGSIPTHVNAISASAIPRDGQHPNLTGAGVAAERSVASQSELRSWPGLTGEGPAPRDVNALNVSHRTGQAEPVPPLPGRSETAMALPRVPTDSATAQAPSLPTRAEKMGKAEQTHVHDGGRTAFSVAAQSDSALGRALAKSLKVSGAQTADSQASQRLGELARETRGGVPEAAATRAQGMDRPKSVAVEGVRAAAVPSDGTKPGGLSQPVSAPAQDSALRAAGSDAPKARPAGVQIAQLPPLAPVEPLQGGPKPFALPEQGKSLKARRDTDETIPLPRTSATGSKPAAQTQAVAPTVSLTGSPGVEVNAGTVRGGSVTAPGLLDFGEEDPRAEALSARGESRGITAPALPQPMAPAARADAAAVLRQVAEGVSRMADGTMELRLTPEELGTVRMSFVNGEHGLTVTVQADRPETLDLLRRHIDQLARDLADAGYENAGFAFSDGKSDQPQSEETPQDEPVSADRSNPEITRGVTRSGLDITL